MVQRAWVNPLGVLWTVKADATQTITAHETQTEALDAARSLLASTGGGELVVKDSTGSIAVTEFVAPRGIHQ